MWVLLWYFLKTGFLEVFQKSFLNKQVAVQYK